MLATTHREGVFLVWLHRRSAWQVISMARDRLTALEVKRAHERGNPVLLPDGAGLYLRKQSATGTAWTLRYRFGGRDRWMALGSYPDMELAEARKAARAKRTLVDAGRDPLLEKHAEIEAQLKASAAKKARGKFKELAEDWYETEIEGRHLKHPAVPRRYLDKYMLPEFGDTVPADITPAMAARGRHDRLAAEGRSRFCHRRAGLLAQGT